MPDGTLDIGVKQEVRGTGRPASWTVEPEPSKRWTKNSDAVCSRILNRDCEQYDRDRAQDQGRDDAGTSRLLP